MLKKLFTYNDFYIGSWDLAVRWLDGVCFRYIKVKIHLYSSL
jgi:hypothetical protein